MSPIVIYKSSSIFSTRDKKLTFSFFFTTMSASFAVPANLHSDKPNGNEEQDSFAIKAGLAQMLKVS